MTSLQTAPPPHYFDDDDMLDDYIDDDDFGGPPPPTTENTIQTKASQNDNQNEEEYWEAMMEFEGQRQQEQQESAPTVTATLASRLTPDATRTSATIDTFSEEMDKEKENENQNRNLNENFNDNSNMMKNNTVEEYLAARRQDNNLYNFQRFKKSKDWRTKASSSSSNQQQQSERRRRLLGSSLFSKHGSRNSSGSFTKTIAPEARFLRLLEANRSGQFYNNIRSETSRNSNTQRLLLEQRSSHGVSTNVFLSPPKADHVPTVPMTLSDGSRVYVRCSPTMGRDGGNATTRTINTAAPDADESMKSCSLGVSMKELFRRVDGMRRRNIFTGRRKREDLATVPSSNSNSVDDNSSRDGMLWVDKHAPKSFPHLLSDERTNREVLRALRGWDPYVFRRDPPLRPLYQRQREQEQQKNTKGDSNKTTTKNDNQNGTQMGGKKLSDKRPEENARVILLSGPPGVGKTTLAHIVARHAGYRPVEVNASDERSSTVLVDRIQRAMESTTINFKPGNYSSDKSADETRMDKNALHSRKKKDDYGKPNCLILDEIDGADARGSIKALVDIVKAEIPSNKSNQKQTYLRRPIICICNHKYAPALRPLLPYVIHFNVEPPSSARLVARLKAILNEEQMPMLGGGPLLHQLVISSGGDIRSSLFTLQFAAVESTDAKDLSEALTNSLSGTGLKDNRNDIASTITTVFRKTKSGAGQVSAKLPSSSSRARDRASVSHVMNAVDGLGDDSAAVNALFMNILRVSYIDPAFDRCSAAHELLSFAADAQHHQSGYAIPVVTAGIHLLCRVEVKPKLTFSSRELADMKYRQDSNLGLIQKFCEGLPAKAKNVKCNSLLAEEFIPLAVWVLSAGDGAASLSRAASSIEILTEKEQDAAKKHVEALCGLGLTYVADSEQEEKQRSGSFNQPNLIEMRMEPPIHRLVEYTSLCHPGGLRRIEIPSKMKELLAHQVLLESFRSHDIRTPETPTKGKIASSIAIDILEKVSSKSTSNSVSPLGLAKGSAKKFGPLTPSILPAPKNSEATPSPTAGNFLGIAAKRGKAAKSARRAAALGLDRSSKKQKLAHSGSGFLLHQVVRMKYVKGFTQAVRTPCRLTDLE